ncbi:hypothetical protein NQ317_013843 [Molorchus minor]|uniref:Uncharacterized protein n=1 Tax=Molorchus minor TaxID=1323400 RepID=A0ABQ9J3K6_9CUCU|nr:hypothetical protein NQ317_013843 [Molorchus minor]
MNIMDNNNVMWLFITAAYVVLTETENRVNANWKECGTTFQKEVKIHDLPRIVIPKKAEHKAVIADCLIEGMDVFFYSAVDLTGATRDRNVVNVTLTLNVTFTTFPSLVVPVESTGE